MCQRRVGFFALLREALERLATAPDFFVAEVRLDAAAARFAVDLEALRDLAALFTALRPVEREADLRALDAFVALLDERAADFLAVDFAADLRLLALAAVLRAPALLADFADFLAVERVDLAALFAAVLLEDFAAIFFAPVLLDLAVVLDPLLRAVEVEDFDALALPPFEPRRALLFLVALDVGLNASTAPVISWVSGLDLSSVGIAASFKGLRVQPSRLQGNVVIPSGFRLTESVESRTSTIPVDTFCKRRVRACTDSPAEATRVDPFAAFFICDSSTWPEHPHLNLDRK